MTDKPTNAPLSWRCLGSSPSSVLYSTHCHTSPTASRRWTTWRDSREPTWWWCCSRCLRSPIHRPWPSPVLQTQHQWIYTDPWKATVIRHTSVCSDCCNKMLQLNASLKVHIKEITSRIIFYIPRIFYTQECCSRVVWLLTLKERTHVPYFRRAATGELADTQLHEEQWHPAQQQAGEVRDEEGSCNRQTNPVHYRTGTFLHNE